MHSSAVLELETDHPRLSDAERRRGLRVNQCRPIKVFEPTAARFFGGQTEDISATGLRVELPHFAGVSAGSVLNVHIGLNTRGESLANRRQMIPARVVWVRREFTNSKPLLSAGLEFMSNISAQQDAA
ncbi:MAG: PilZ domain-containing protein [Phycisphaerae bacterium]|nr:PilZ domain-containing protein [Phycisphaerae bacterium]